MARNKKMKLSKESYRATFNPDGADGSAPSLPKKQFYRQRAHANPFADHAFE
jgi:hypothetical protein